MAAREALHPLQTELIVDRILTLGDFEPSDLTSIRLVCRYWHTRSLDFFRRKATLLIKDSKSHLRTGQIQGVNAAHAKALSMATFLVYYDDPEDRYELAKKPFRRYCFVNCTYNSDHSGARVPKSTVRFWNIVTPLMEHLHVLDCPLKESGRLPVEPFFYTQRTPRLSNLRVAIPHKRKNGEAFLGVPFRELFPNVTITTVDSIRYNGPIELLFHLLYVYQNLKTLILESEMPFEEMKAVLDEIQARNFHLESSVTNLDLMNLFSKAVECDEQFWFTGFRFINNYLTNLESITIDLGLSPDLLRMKVYFMCLHHQETLRELKLFRAPYEIPYSTEMFFGELELIALTHLYIHGTIASSLEFLKIMPNLQTLVMDKYGVEYIHKYVHILERGTDVHLWRADIVDETLKEDEMGGFVMNHMKRLEMKDYDLSTDSLMILKLWMPNLTAFGGMLDNDKLRLVCREWKDLQVLKVFPGSDVTDEGISGFKHGPLRFITPVALKDLREFELDAHCDQGNLTDDCIEGFLKMRCLQKLRIHVSEEMTEKAEESLKQSGIPNVTVIRNCDDRRANCCQFRELMDNIELQTKYKYKKRFKKC